MAVKNPYANAFGSGSGEAASLGANQADFFGEGLDATGPAAPAAPAVDPAQSNLLRNRQMATDTANINAKQDRTTGTGAPMRDGSGLATDGYYAGNDATRASYDYMHALGSGPNTMADFFNQEGEKVGVSHAGDATGLNNPIGIQNPLDFNPVQGVIDPTTGLGTTAGTNGGKPVGAVAPDAAALAGRPVAQTGGDALTQAMAGLGGSDIPVDTSGNDRGGMGLGGAYSTQLGAMDNQANADRSLGQGVLNGQIAPGGAGAQGQQDALDQAMGFMNGPRKQNDVMGDVNGFLSAPTGPSAAELQLQQGAQGNMADALSLARSGRARDAGSQARMMSQALANNAATGVDTNRDTALLRAKEAEARRGQDLSALGLKGNLAQGLDSDTLKALGLGGDLATQLRQGNITERGQGLQFAQGQQQIGAGLQGDALKAIPQLEGIRHSDQFDLTPQQKLAAAKLGGAPDKTTADYVTGLLGDVLSAI